MKVGIISDGQYGERAFEAIRQVFDTIWILVPDIPTTIMIEEDLELDIPRCDLYISYARHPDIILMLAELDKPLVLGVLPGTGLLRQATSINDQVVGPRTMCSLEPDTGIPEIDEFAKYFGHPEFQLSIDEKSGIVHEAVVNRKSPCGSSVAGATFIKGKKIELGILQDFALTICHECRAPRFGHTCDKEVSGMIHVLSLVKAFPSEVKDILDVGIIAFLEGLRSEYNRRTTH
ncbi:MAG: DUF166 family protein [Candidatus Hodarchaeota archaeon]